MTESAQKSPQQRGLSGPLHDHLGEAAKPEVVKDGYIPLGKAARDQAEAGGGFLFEETIVDRYGLWAYMSYYRVPLVADQRHPRSLEDRQS